MNVMLGRNYVTHTRCAVRILCTDALGTKTPVIGLIKSGDSEIVGKWAADGTNNNSSLNLIEVTAWDGIEVDTPVYVRDSTHEPWKHAHFASVMDGMPCVWVGGGTSFTTAHSVGYMQCKVTL